MFGNLKEIHHYLGMATLMFIFLITVVCFIYYVQKRPINTQIRRISLFTIIFTHTQVVLGIATYFSSPIFQGISMKDLMKIAQLRQNYVEHPFSMIIVAVLVTIVNSKLKKVKIVSLGLTLMVVISLALVIGMIPRTFWSNLI